MDIDKFYKRINKKMIEGFIKNDQEEHLNLEFKTVSKADLSDKRDQENLSKCIAGFANSNGGIIVWGVDARQNQEGLDCACGFKEIQPLSQLISKLNDLTGELVKPIVEGVKHKKIPPKAEKGFAVTLVPESDAGPHMAMKFKGRHYKRSGDSFYPMEHFDIEDMFGRRKKPSLSLFTILRGEVKSKGSDVIYKLQIFFGLKNTGRGIAKYIYLALRVNPPYLFSSNGLREIEKLGLRRVVDRTGEFIRIFGDANLVIHPNSILEIVKIERSYKGHPQIEDLEVEAEIRAEEMRVVHEKKTYLKSDVIKRAFKGV